MAERNPANWLQNLPAGQEYTAALDRLVLQALARNEGVYGVPDLKVTSAGGMSVSVAAGQAFIQGDNDPYQGMYAVWNDGPVVLALANGGANNRRDLIVARVYDTAYPGNGATSLWRLEVVQGSMATTPGEPPLPGNAIALASVYVAANATSITNAIITEKRYLANPRSIDLLLSGTPTGNDDLTAGLYTSWPAAISPRSVSRPSWATHGVIEAFLLGIKPITSASIFNVRGGFDNTPGVGFTVSEGALNSRAPVLIVDKITLPTSSSTMNVVIQGQRASGTGALRADTSSDLRVLVRFLEEIV